MSPLISATVLRSLLPTVTVLDVRWQLGRSDGHQQYLSGHIPGAVYVDLETDLADPPADPPDERGRHPLPDPDRFAASMRRCGVTLNRPVVVYDDTAGAAGPPARGVLRLPRHPPVGGFCGGGAGGGGGGG